MENNVATALFDLLVTRDFAPEILDSMGKPISDPSEAELFSFDWRTQDRDYGTVVILLGTENDLEVYYGDNLGRNMEREDKNQWYDFLAQIKNFATRNLLTFNLNNINRLKYTMQGMAAIREGLFESFRGTRRTSYSAGPRQTRLVIQHSRDLGEGEARHHAIGSIFVETAQGERFRVPSRSITHGRMLERHIAEGGTPYDAFGHYINNLVTEIATLNRFIRATRGRGLSDPARQLAAEAVKHYHDLKSKAKRMISQRGYLEARDSFDPAAVSDHDDTVDQIREMFVERNIDERIESALPVLARLQHSTMREVQQFEDWSRSIMEGIWRLPETPEQMATLVELMSEPLPVGPDATNATEQLYDLFGDDELFDQLTDLADQDAAADARPLIMARLAELGIDLESLAADMEQSETDTNEDLDTDGVMMTRPSNMSSESHQRELQDLRRLLA